ncbi:MAG TPA: ATP-binding protein [Chryseolinea sp.]|nr:ATP-binding protein [Chryseolinea sp.]
MKISFLILSGFFLILLLFSITTYINYQQSEKVNENSDKFSKSSTTLRNSNRFQRNILNLVSGLRGYLLTNETFFIQSYDSAVIENEEILTELSFLTKKNESQKKLLDEIASLYDRWGQEFATPLLEAKKQAMVSDSGAKAFETLYRKKLSDRLEDDIQQKIQRKFREFTNSEYAFREEQRVTLTASVRQTRTISFYLTVLSIVLGIGIAGFLASHISSGILRMVNMADAISAGNYDVQVDDRGVDEIGRLTASLNNMAKVLAEHIALLKQKNEELNQFAHIVSHDIKTPLRGIDNVVSWIEEDHDVDIPIKVKEYVRLIKGRVTRAESLLNGILSYSRIGREVQKKEKVHIDELIEEIRGYLPEKKHVTLIVQHPLPTIYTERLPLFQVFSNLLNNAYNYHNKENGIVKVYYEELADHFKFFVEDDGPGIAKNYHEKIFVIFQTLQEEDSAESTGVGLAIVKKILTDRKLEIGVTSEPGKGSTFSFTWPKH